MNVVLQTNNSENNRVIKTITDLTTVNVNLLSPTSISNPVLSPLMITGGIGTVKTCNYFTIPDLGRSYFINEIISLGKDMVEIRGHVDVISSFSIQILSNKAVIARQEKKYNKYLNDSLFKVYQNKQVKTEYLSGAGFTTAGYILVTAGQSGKT